ncbi:MAG: alpha/beta hydrolase [Moraxellaceae bacterium]|nr:alpha/beta hydrolase [Moraxellaceae bacterium]MDZ4387680.1 alpha/beta hydrolase [Moraxellaceae bacterium]
MRVVFVHGKESGPQGLKINAMSAVVKALGFEVFAPDLRERDDPQWRTQQLLAVLESGPAYIVGSSLGGYVAANAAALAPSQVLGLFLLCPAFDLPGYPLTRPDQPLRGEQVYFVHGRHDSVVPLANSERAARDWQASLVTVEDDHPLHDSVDLICHHLRAWLSQQERLA